MIDWTDISNYGDVTITSLAAAAIAAWLFVEDEKRLAFYWSTLFAGAMGIVIATKMAFIGWGIGIRAIDFAGFSGHAMRAAAVLPVLFYLILQRAPGRVRALGIVLGFACATAIAVSRVVLHTHSVSEVVAGFLLGMAVSGSFIRVAHESLSKHVFKPLRIVLSMLALLPAPYVHPAPTQLWLTEITLYVSGHEQPFPRSEWREGRTLRAPPAR
ncbi:MAG TPA: phosphatase PAP2 family protein [Noviherbaspirillum sp.]|uniref:phosphatase PAP2 family protein n=1 Tax=Noviherbaspirillum sp. TaxID=1926288 RepID=UPI002D55A006|nr:phosphatase PAP2 family protein [Noviherbaspirillum sp.]HYD97485.1 phosphatase PAP2 family protein [Noviherbaspirillum sp.]